MSRTSRWIVAGVCVLLMIGMWSGMTEAPSDKIVGLIGTLVFALVIGFMLAPDIGSLTANLFVGGIMGENVKFDRPPQIYGPARALAAQERYGEAIEEYRRVLRMHPGDIEAQTGIAEIYLEKLGDLERGMQEFNTLLSLKLDDSRRVTILMRLADLYDERYNHPGYAAKCLAEIVRRFPESKYAAAAGERLAQLKQRHPDIGQGEKQTG